MDIITQKTENEIRSAVTGKIDTNTAPELETKLKSSLKTDDTLILDLTDTTYISSYGLRVILSLHKMLNAHGKLIIQNPNPSVMEVFDMTGFSDILNIEKTLKEISLDGLTLLNAGMFGECWKVDNETILKLYFEDVDEDVVKQEKELAKIAFITGIPTAISYDMVACGKRRGVLYELLDAKSLSNTIASDLANLEQYAQLFANLCKIIHSTKADERFPNVKDGYRNLIKTSEWIPPSEQVIVLNFLENIPDTDTCIHGDLHPGNIMLQKEEPLFIDMGEFSRGYYMFDIGLIYTVFRYQAGTPIGLRLTGLSIDDSLRFWELFIEYYFGADTDINSLENECLKYLTFKMIFYSNQGADIQQREQDKKEVLDYFIPLLTN